VFLLLTHCSLLVAFIVTFSEARRTLEQALSDAGIESARAEARWLLEHLFFVTLESGRNDNTFQQGFRGGKSINTKSANDTTGFSTSNFSPLQKVNIEINAEQLELLNQWLERRVKREPLQHILGVAPFYGLELAVSPDVLIPRPETELLVELVLKAIKPLPRATILDVGTGSGAIALAIKHERPDAAVMATDISAKALAVARQNAEKYKLDVSWLESDLLKNPQVQTFATTCDVLVANLPYLPSSDKESISPEVLHDPDLALYAGVDGLELFRRLEQEAFQVGQPKTLCFFELDPRNVEIAYTLCQHWEQREILEDLVGRKRFLKLSK
jgi:release factor glutamine methyltransferase